MRSNEKVTGSITRIPQLHVKASLSKILNPKLLSNWLIDWLNYEQVGNSVWMCVWMGECVKCYKVLWSVSWLEKMQ